MKDSDRDSTFGLVSRRDLLLALAAGCLTAPWVQRVERTLRRESSISEGRAYRQRWFELYAESPERHLRGALHLGLAEAPGLIRQAEIERGEYADCLGSLVTKSELALLVLLDDAAPGAI